LQITDQSAISILFPIPETGGDSLMIDSDLARPRLAQATCSARLALIALYVRSPKTTKRPRSSQGCSLLESSNEESPARFTRGWFYSVQSTLS